MAQDFRGEIDEMQATTLRALASSGRVRLVHLLIEGPREVREISAALGLGQAVTSQHLAALRSVGVVEATRDGRVVRYRLADPDIAAACTLMRTVLVRRLARLGRVAAAAARAPYPTAPTPPRLEATRP